MNTLSATLTLRPTRIGFLVEPTDTRSLRRIFEICTCLWGGVFNPIIPVCSALPDAWREQHHALDPTPEDLAKGYIRFFEPDVFVDSDQTLANKAGISNEELDFGRPRVVGLDEFLTSGELQRDVPFGTDIFHVYKVLYEREFKFVPRHARRVAIFDTDPANDAFAATSFGQFPTVGPLSHLAQAYQDAFDPVKLATTAADWIKAITGRYDLPLHFTREFLKRDPDGLSDPTLFVVDPASPLDLIDLWNLRIFHSRTLGVSVTWMKEARDFIVEFIKQNHRPLPLNPGGLMIDSTVQFGRSISEERANAAVEEAGLTSLPNGSWSLKRQYDRIWLSDWADFVAQPRRARIFAASADLELPIHEEKGRFSCRFKSLAPEFAPSYGDGSARWINILELNKYGTNDEVAVALPLTFSDKARRGMRVGETTIISREGFVLPQCHKNFSEYFQLLTGEQAIVEWLKSQGIEAEHSDPGRIADQIIASLDGFWGTRLIADRETIKLLDDMSKSVRRYADNTLEEFPDRSMEVKRWKDLVNRRSERAPFRKGPTLDEFVKAKILRLGLVLECVNCRKKNWFSIGNLRERVACERCLREYDFPQGTLNFERTPWHYRVVGPYSVPNYADGGYASVLALGAFARGLGGDPPNVTYATGLHFKIGAENPFEVDFTLWYQRKRTLDLQEEPVLAFGESKSFATESFKEEDVGRMRKLAEKCPGAFLVFAALKDELTDTEKSAISQIATWGRGRLHDGRPRAPVIVLTGTELFATWDIPHTWKKLGGKWAKFADSPRGRLDNLWQLADITQELYLDLNPNADVLQLEADHGTPST